MSPPIEPCAPGFTARVLRGPAPFPEVTVWPSAKEELQRLLEKLDRDVYAALVACGEDLASLVEIENTCTEDDIRRFDHFILDPRTRAVHPHKRSGINGTLHRLSVITHPLKASDSYSGELGVIDRLAPFLVDSTESLLLIGRPGVGKTTLLREIAKRLSANSSLVVVVVDKTCEIAGDGVAPHAAIGSARWMPVGRPGLQAQILREAVENQSPSVIIVDEISTSEEVEAARTIAQRGVRLIASVHGVTLPEIVNDSERRNLAGGQVSVTLTDSAAQQRADKRKTVATRLREPAFGAALELHERDLWVWHPSVRDAVDSYLNGEPVLAELLRPGRAEAVFALAEKDSFTYCLECGRLNKLCAKHEPPPLDPAEEAAGAERIGRRGARGVQFSGKCFHCNRSGHIRMHCPDLAVRRGGGGGGSGAGAGVGGGHYHGGGLGGAFAAYAGMPPPPPMSAGGYGGYAAAGR